MPSITSWTRLEPRARSETMATSLQARIHDPLWLLARQWQFGEFQGEDTGSPVHAETTFEQSEIERYCHLPDTPSLAKDYDNSLPLECWVEREPVREMKPNYRLIAEAGLQYLRLMGPSLAAKYKLIFLQVYAVTQPSENDRLNLDNDSKRLLSVVAGRVIDGALLRKKFSQKRKAGDTAVLPNEAPFTAIDPNDSFKMVSATTQWLDWYDMLFSQPEADSAWVPERMEYEFAVGAPVTSSSGVSDELVLLASEYFNGHLDWFSFEVDSKHKLGVNGKPIAPQTVKVIPTPIHFRGMPATRWWEFEDAEVNFGGVDTAPEDLARLLLAEFTLIYGNDFFVIPIDLPVGSIARITRLQVTNTFGETFQVEPASRTDVAATSDVPWRMFCLSSLEERSGAKSVPLEFLFLPPVLGASFEGPPIEEVLLLRDEMANMAWAVERVVESPAGLPFNRFEAFQEGRRRKEESDPDSTIPHSGRLEYRLSTSVPDYWIPLIPIHTGSGNRDIELRLGMLNEPLGRVLRLVDATESLSLNEEEVPREGAIITRSYQYARWTDGSTYLWIGRRKRTGRGEGSSGLRFDVIEPA